MKIRKYFKSFITVLFISYIFILSNISALDNININSKKAILYNLNDDKIIYDKNSNDRTYVASLTKIMTALVTLEQVDDLDKIVTVTTNDLRNLDGYAKAGFKVGDKVNYKDLLYGLLLVSGADCAQILANNIAGSISAFSELMNKKVEQLNLKNTHFSNPVGMDEDNYSTAYDMAIILKNALMNEQFQQIFTSHQYKASNGLDLKKNTDKISSDFKLDISNIKGSKTGFTYLAEYCFASIATIDDVSYLAVTLNADNNASRIKDSLILYDYFSSNYSYQNILNKGDYLTKLKVKGSKTKEYEIISNKNIQKYLSNDFNKKDIKYKYQGIKVIDRKIKKGDYLGKVNIIYNGDILDVYKVYLDKDIKYYNYYLIFSLILGILLIIIICSRMKYHKKHKKR